MIKLAGLPALVAMALLTLVAVITLVHIIKLMAAHTGHLDFDLFGVFLMAGRATQASVLVEEGKFGLAVMIKTE